MNLTLICSYDCAKCEMAKKMLTKNGISFEDKMFDDLSDIDKSKYKELANSKGLISFPLIIKGKDELIELTEALMMRSVKVRKRNDEEVDFDKVRVVNAIQSAMIEANELDNRLASYIAEKIESSIINRDIVSVEEIQDMVERELMSSNCKITAKRYILYRESKNIERHMTIESEDEGKLLTDEFINKYKHVNPPFTEFGEIVYYRTYSRFLPNLQRREYWYETVRRAVEYNCSILKTTRKEAEELYDNIFHLRQFLSGRTFWTGNTKAAKLYPMSNFNCAFIIIDNFQAYEDIFYASMVGTGIGFRVLFDDVEKLPKIRTDIKLISKQYEEIEETNRKEHTSIEFDKNICTITIGDSKEGWVDALGLFLKLFYSKRYRAIDMVVINYDNIRPFGEKLKVFGGTASGYTSMRNMVEKIHKIITNNSEGRMKKLRPIDAMDIANMIAENVVSGGVRRSAQICLFDANDKDILQSKSKLFYQNNKGEWIIDKELSHRQMSNNSIYYNEKPTKEQIHWQIQQMRYNGEPAFINGVAIRKRRADGNGVNPCGEILLNNKGMCNLTTVNLMAFVKDGKLDKEALMRAQILSARAGYRMANIELELHEWDLVLKKDKLVGCSFTGLQDMINAVGMTEEEEIALYKEMRDAVHRAIKEYGEEVGRDIPKLMTTIKPEGTLSCLPTVSSGLHYTHSEYFIRRVRMSASDPLAKVCKELEYPVYPEVGHDPLNPKTVVIEFPIRSAVKEGVEIKTKYNVTAIEQLENYKRTMKYYTDHNTSITVSVREHEWDTVEEWMNENWNDVVGISFLPLDDAVYPLAPFEAITKEEYEKRVANMRKFNPILLKKYEVNTLEDLDIVDSECSTGACGVR